MPKWETTALMDHKQYRRADDVVLRTIAGEHFLIVLHAGESKMFCLNGTALWFWRKLESPATKAGLLVAMLKEYDVDEVSAEHEINRFLMHLSEKKLVQMVAPDKALTSSEPS